jgi:glycosyltransferase involved in cell wall biosynthesis
MKISIIMAVYNAQAYLNEAIDSVLNQQYDNWELICVDDGSVDSSLNTLKGYSAIDKRIKIVSSIHSGNASSARNKALPHVTGDYTCILDSDDKFELNLLSELVSVISASCADFIVFSTKFCDSQCNHVLKEISGFQGKFDSILTGENAFIQSLNWNISGIGAIKSELVQRLKWNENGMNGDELSTRLFFLESELVAFTKGNYLYRQHSESTTKKMSKKTMLTLDTNLSLISLIDKNNIDKKIRLEEISKYGNAVRAKYRLLVKNKSLFTAEEYTDLKKYIKRHYLEMLNLENPLNKRFLGKQVRWVCFKIENRTKKKLYKKIANIIYKNQFKRAILVV